MTAATATLADFLLARIAEDEVNAQRYVEVLPDGDMAPLFRRVLREVEAKRRIVGLHSGDNDTMCQSWEGNYVEEPCPTLRALASVYADHEDYRAEWAL